MYQFHIDEISVNTARGPLSIVPKKINVLVGPNNAGKSRLLREIRDYLSGDMLDLKMLDEIRYPFPENLSELDAAYHITDKMTQDINGNWMLKSYSNKPTQALDMNVTLENYHMRSMSLLSGDWVQHFEQIISMSDRLQFFTWCGPLFYQYLGTEERLTICKTQRNYGLDRNGINFMSSVRFKGQLLDELTDKVWQLFKRDIFLDTQTLGDRLAFRVGEDFSYAKNGRINSEDLARRLFRESLLDNQGDGLKSFVSTFLALKSDRCSVLLLDEPEAFLHPPLARQVGELIAEAQAEERSIFVATHSVEVLKGILSKSQDVNVIRIAQPRPGENEITVLEQDVLDNILQDALLRVSRVLEGVFCEKVVITEAEADELVYQELLEKIVPESGAYFAHGQNKQTLAEIAKMYQKIGIQYEIITDFDVLRVPSEFYRFLLLMPLDERERQRILSYANRLRVFVNQSVNTDGLSKEDREDKEKRQRRNAYHKQGVRFFEEDAQKKIRGIFDLLSAHHLHILETGELETILEEYGVGYASDKGKWFDGAIKRIAELKPEDIRQESMVFRFISRIAGVPVSVPEKLGSSQREEEFEKETEPNPIHFLPPLTKNS